MNQRSQYNFNLPRNESNISPDIQIDVGMSNNNNDEAVGLSDHVHNDLEFQTSKLTFLTYKIQYLREIEEVVLKRLMNGLIQKVLN